MKKLVLMFALMLGLAACNTNSTKQAPAEVDTTMVDTVIVDTIVVDTLTVDSMCTL